VRLSLGAILVISSCLGCAGGVVKSSPGTGPSVLRASFKGRLEAGGERQRFEGTLAASPPDRLRVEIAGPLGGTRILVAATGDRVLVLFPPTREYLDERNAAAAFDALLGVPLDTASLVDLIRLGEPDACAAAPCEKRLPLPDGLLVVTRQGDTITARPAPRDEDPQGFRALELRLLETEVTGAGPEDLFAPGVPAGWTRIRLDPHSRRGTLLRPS